MSIIVWCTGFSGGYSCLKVPGSIGTDHQPMRIGGTGTASGLYFAGLDFASTRKSGTIMSSLDESRMIVSQIVGRLGQLGGPGGSRVKAAQDLPSRAAFLQTALGRPG